MLRNSTFAVAFVTGWLVLYYILFQAGAPLIIIGGMFAASPVLVAWMVITLLKHGKYTGRELAENEEWGYGDRKKTGTNDR